MRKFKDKIYNNKEIESHQISGDFEMYSVEESYVNLVHLLHKKNVLSDEELLDMLNVSYKYEIINKKS